MSKKIITCGILLAVAIVVSSLEKFVPIQAFIPLPGLKLGIANCIILFSLVKLDFKSAFSIMLCKCLIVSFLFSNPISFIYSFFGGFLSLLGMYCALMAKRFFSVIGVSMCGAALFNIGQIIAASILLKSVDIFKYLVVLLPTSIITGILVGIISMILIKNLGEFNGCFRSKI